MTRSLICTVMASLFLAAPAHAGPMLHAFWERNVITPQAVAADSTGALSNSQSWSLMVTHTTGDWASAGLRVVLPAGATFYNTAADRGGGDTTPTPQAVFMFPDVEFDTYVAGTMEGAQATIVDGFPLGSPVSFGGPADPLPGTFSVAWGDLVQAPPSTFEIARLTFPATLSLADVYVQNDLPGGSGDPDNSHTAIVGPDVFVLIPNIPEPGTLTPLVGLAGALVLRRHCRSRPVES